MLARSSTIRALPSGMGLIAFYRGALGLAIACLGLVFKRGAWWGALYLFIWDRAIWILPGNLQRLTFAHYVENIAGTKSSVVNASHMLAQTQIATPALVAAVVLLLAGAAFWALAGWKLQATPIGLAGVEAEG